MPPKKERGSIKAIFSDMFELPKEVVLDLPRLTMVGNLQMCVENHRGVIAYNEEKIRIGLSNGELIITGKELQIKNLLAEELLIKGSIDHLFYEV